MVREGQGMKPRRHGLSRWIVLGVNAGLIGGLALVGTVVLYGPQHLRGQDSLLIPDDSLVFEGKVLDLNLTKAADQLVLNAQSEATVYLVKTDTEVLSQATVELEVPALGLTTSLQEASSGVYSVTLPEELILTPQAEGRSLTDIAEWKIQPLAL